MPNALCRRALLPIAACASSFGALVTSSVACGPSSLVVERPPTQVATDPSAASPEVAREDCDLEPRIAAVGRGCRRVAGEAAVGTGAEPDATRAFDGDACSVWNAGGFAPQSVTVDLGARTEISALLLVPEMTPASATVTLVLEVSDDGRAFGRARQLHAPMRTGELTHLSIPGGETTRFVRVSITESPSWVAWRDIAVLHCGG